MANPRPAQTTCLSNCHPGIDQGTVTPNRSSPEGAVGKDEDSWFSPVRDAVAWTQDALILYATIHHESQALVWEEAGSILDAYTGKPGESLAPIGEVWDQRITNMANAHNRFSREHEVGAMPAVDALAWWFAGTDKMKRALFEWYLSGKGEPRELTHKEMDSMPTLIDVFETKNYSTRMLIPIEEAKKGQPVSVKTVVSGQNDAMGNFRVQLDGILKLATGTPAGSTDIPYPVGVPLGNPGIPMVFEGTMSWSDKWDFDPKMAARLKEHTGRGMRGELQVDAVAALADGVPFEITSVTVPMTQYSGRYPIY